MARGRPRRRKVHYMASSLADGTVLAAAPMRKPAPRILKERGFRIDDDGVTNEFASGWKQLSDSSYEGRLRFLDIIATNLNTRRAIRELVLPPLAELQAEVTALRAEVATFKEALSPAAGR